MNLSVMLVDVVVISSTILDSIVEEVVDEFVIEAINISFGIYVGRPSTFGSKKYSLLLLRILNLFL